MKRLLALSACISTVISSQHIFSIDDDILAFPQYEVVFSDSFISEIDADYHLAAAAARSSSHPKATTSPSPESIESLQHTGELAPRTARDGGTGSTQETSGGRSGALHVYESLVLDGRRYLCTIPIVEAAPKNESAEAVARAAEEKELALATRRGWELLQDMERQCLYHISDWWSYRFCYNGKVTQFHRLPPQKGVPFFPPLEDPTVPSYILGQTKKPAAAADPDESEEDKSPGELARVKPNTPDSTELQTKGDTRYLVQRFGHGTTCDLTGKDRKIEVQFHCQPQAPDRIGWIKEVSTCSYMMVVYTSRLCDDVAFLPPQENKAHAIACREVVKPDDIEDWKARTKMDDMGRRLPQSEGEKASEDGDAHNEEASSPRFPIIGGIPVGARQHVGSGPSRQIKGGAAVGGDGKVTIVMRSDGTARKGGRVEKLSDEQLRRLKLDPNSVEAWGKEMEEAADGKGWTLEIVTGVGGENKIRGILETDDDDDGEGREGEADGDEQQEENSGDGGGSEEDYREEL